MITDTLNECLNQIDMEVGMLPSEMRLEYIKRKGFLHTTFAVFENTYCKLQQTEKLQKSKTLNNNKNFFYYLVIMLLGYLISILIGNDNSERSSMFFIIISVFFVFLLSDSAKQIENRIELLSLFFEMYKRDILSCGADIDSIKRICDINNNKNSTCTPSSSDKFVDVKDFNLDEQINVLWVYNYGLILGNITGSHFRFRTGPECFEKLKKLVRNIEKSSSVS